jgi:nitric oxide reductase activation protein
LESVDNLPRNTQIEVARRSALATALALESIHGTSVNCVAFGKQRSVTVLTGFGERVEPTAHRYGAIEAEGGTPLAEALWCCAPEILARKEKRKILLVITDGEPNDFNAARRIIHNYLDAGIEAIGLGIELTNIRDLFPVSAVIHDLTQLPKALFQLLQQGFTHGQSLRTA